MQVNDFLAFKRVTSRSSDFATHALNSGRESCILVNLQADLRIFIVDSRIFKSVFGLFFKIFLPLVHEIIFDFVIESTLIL